LRHPVTLNSTPVKTTEDVDRVLKRDYNRSTLSMESGRGRFAYNLPSRWTEGKVESWEDPAQTLEPRS